MTWVVANPLRDPGVFCGAVGCGLCFDWADDQSEEVTEGIRYIASQLLQIAIAAVTAEMIEQVREGLLRAHASVVSVVPAPGPEDYDEAQQLKRIAIQTKGIVRSVVAERIVKNKPKRARSSVVIDQMSEKDVAKAAKKPARVKDPNIGVVPLIADFQQIDKNVVDRMKRYAEAAGVYGTATNGSFKPQEQLYSRDEWMAICKQYAYSQGSEAYLLEYGMRAWNVNRDAVVLRDGELSDLLRMVQQRRYKEQLPESSSIEKMMMRSAEAEAARETAIRKQQYNEEKMKSRAGWVNQSMKSKVPIK
jgi:hypothetical protein